MIRWLASTWDAVWPNLLANVLWVPLAAFHHWRLKQHINNANKKDTE